MVKRIIAVLVCFVLLLSFYIPCYIGVNAQKDNVTVLERVVLGDKSIADGLKVDFYSDYNETLFWHTEYTLGEGSKAKTSFQFSKEKLYGGHEVEDHFDMYTMVDTFTSSTGTIRFNSLQGAYQELVDSATPYEENKKVIKLKDYYEYYPFCFEFTFGDYHFDHYLYMGFNDQSEEDKLIYDYLSSFFKIPVLENEMLAISVVVDGKGNVVQSGSSSAVEGADYVECYNLYTLSATDNEYCYVVFNNRTDMGNIVDTSNIEGGYGIYRFKKPQKADDGKIELFDIENVYPVDEKDTILGFEMSKDKSEIYLITRNNEKDIVLNIIDTKTLKLKQQLEIFNKADYGAYVLHKEDDFIVLEVSTEGYSDLTETYYVVLTIDESGKYKKEFSTKCYESGSHTYFYYEYTDAKFDGENLYFIAPFKDSFYDENSKDTQYCGFTVTVYNKDGIQLLSKYDLSLSTGKFDSFGYMYVEPDDTKPATITLP